MRQLADAPVIQSQCNLDGLVDQANFDNIDIPLQIRQTKKLLSPCRKTRPAVVGINTALDGSSIQMAE